jgi:uncharacterized protein YbaR (Trm112 family)
MPLAPELVETLVCPKSKQKLIYFEADATLVCPSSRLSYRIDRGIPVLLVDEATQLSQADVDRYLAKAKELGLPNA